MRVPGAMFELFVNDANTGGTALSRDAGLEHLWKHEHTLGALHEALGSLDLLFETLQRDIHTDVYFPSRGRR